jgi:hypothetical protein
MKAREDSSFVQNRGDSGRLKRDLTLNPPGQSGDPTCPHLGFGTRTWVHPRMWTSRSGEPDPRTRTPGKAANQDGGSSQLRPRSDAPDTRIRV